MLLSINIVHMVSAFTSVFLFFPALVGEPLNAIVVSRMMLNLREVNQPRPQTSNQDLLSFPSFVYRQQTQITSAAHRRMSHDTLDEIVSRYGASTLDWDEDSSPGMH
ncbi:hypothetical protein C8Q73DRAFT_363905 [Cubamyces lactineus]|nr:hypothetical protein C8Q73DRAFT_363905 [Cubamyces lactineus]